MNRIFQVILILVFAACNKSEQTVTNRDSEGSTSTLQLEQSGETRVVKSQTGEVLATGTRGGAAAEFPEYAPQYPGSNILSSVKMQMVPGGPPSNITTMDSSDAMEKIVAFYRTKAEAAGLKVTERETGTGVMLLVGPTGKLGMAELMVTVDPSGTGSSRISATLTR